MNGQRPYRITTALSNLSPARAILVLAVVALLVVGGFLALALTTGPAGVALAQGPPSPFSPGIIVEATSLAAPISTSVKASGAATPSGWPPSPATRSPYRCLPTTTAAGPSTFSGTEEKTLPQNHIHPVQLEHPANRAHLGQPRHLSLRPLYREVGDLRRQRNRIRLSQRHHRRRRLRSHTQRLHRQGAGRRRHLAFPFRPHRDRGQRRHLHRQAPDAARRPLQRHRQPLGRGRRKRHRQPVLPYLQLRQLPVGPDRHRQRRAGRRHGQRNRHHHPPRPRRQLRLPFLPDDRHRERHRRRRRDAHPRADSHPTPGPSVRLVIEAEEGRKLNRRDRNGDPVPGVEVPRGGSSTFTVKLGAQPTANVPVSITEISDSDNVFHRSPGWLTFTRDNWNVGQTVTVSSSNNVYGRSSGGNLYVRTGDTDDGRYDRLAASWYYMYETEPVALRLSAAAIKRDGSGAGSITVAEGSSVAYDIRLNTKPTANVILTLAATGDNDVTVSPTSLTFTPNNLGEPPPGNRQRGPRRGPGRRLRRHHPHRRQHRHGLPRPVRDHQIHRGRRRHRLPRPLHHRVDRPRGRQRNLHRATQQPALRHR